MIVGVVKHALTITSFVLVMMLLLAGYLSVLKRTQSTLDLELALGRSLSKLVGLYLFDEYFLATR